LPSPFGRECRVEPKSEVDKGKNPNHI